MSHPVAHIFRVGSKGREKRRRSGAAPRLRGKERKRGRGHGGGENKGGLRIVGNK